MISKTKFKSPETNFRSCPFWSLNDRLDPAEMVRQVEEFHRAGMGGFFLHSRIGLITEYLGHEWMDALRAAIKKAGELGMQAWLYDEDKWPSGFAGGIIPLQNPEFRGRYLGRIRDDANLPEQSNVVLKKDNWIYFTATVLLGIAEFNGTCYTDLMNPAAVKAYIESTHEKYKKEFGQYFGTVIPGIFTDEPIMRMRPNWLPAGVDYLPYSPCLFERYQKNYGESPFTHLPELFEDIENSAKYRYRYWKTATEQFVEAFTKQVSDWCEENKLKLTGHFMYEDSAVDQTRWIGKAMAHYEYMQIPGIDHLSLNIDNILTAKQCSSVAHQQGKKEILSEMFGCAGQNMTFEDRKWIAGWHGVMGINFVCHHLSLYSLRGCRKRDYPPTFTWHQPYWEDNATVENWQARFSCLLREGKPEADFLIIHPAESGWCLQKGCVADQKLKDIDTQIKTICQEMFRIHRDFDLGDEDYLARHASIDIAKLCVGKMNYRAVIVPPMLSMRKSTLDLLEKFSSAGGIVITLGDLPELMDGEYSNALQLLKSIAAFNLHDIEELKNTLDNACRSEVKITGENADNVFIRHQKTDRGELLILFNSSRLNTASIDLPQPGVEFSLETGKEIVINKTPLILSPAQTRVVLLEKDKKKIAIQATETINHSEILLNGQWMVNCEDLNALPLDFVQWSIDGINWQAAEPVLGLKIRLDHEKYSGPLMLRYCFLNKCICLNNIFFVAEINKNDVLMMNGQKIGTGTGWFLDKCLLKTDISKQIVPGLNTIEVRLNYVCADAACYLEPVTRYGTELETAFIIGDFGVYGEKIEITMLPKQVSHDIWPDDLPERRTMRLSKPYIADQKEYSNGELTLSGLPFYAGTVVMSKDFELSKTDSCWLSLEHLDAISGKVLVNGTEVSGLLSSRPLALDISNLVKPGSNTLSIELKNSLRNLFGPHHSAMGELAGVGPYSFISRDFEPGKYVPDKNWSRPENRATQKSWTDDYFIVKFGLDSGIKIFHA